MRANEVIEQRLEHDHMGMVGGLFWNVSLSGA
jgi:hypothetical protein